MPFQKTFRILLEEDNTDGSILDSVGGASFVSLNGTDTAGTANASQGISQGLDAVRLRAKSSRSQFWRSPHLTLAT